VLFEQSPYQSLHQRWGSIELPVCILTEEVDHRASLVGGHRGAVQERIYQTDAHHGLAFARSATNPEKTHLAPANLTEIKFVI
jgi:hypothetical protein